ncbi:MAG: hypothetical protein ABI418_19080 [Jatrophihabitantaceae bacterium]
MLTAGSASAATTFGAQASAAGMTGQQAQQLQRLVNGYVSQTGGKQVSANRVNFAGGYVLVASPGQRYAGDLASNKVTPYAYSSCGSGDFCAYSGPNGTGALKAYYICQDVVPFTSGNGSVYNHQTGGAQTKLYKYNNGGGGIHLALTLNAGSTASWSWPNTADVRTC